MSERRAADTMARMSTPREIPEARLDIADPFDEAAVEAAIVAKAAELEAAGLPTTFQVWYGETPASKASTPDDFDVVTVSDLGTRIETEPSYLSEATDG